LSKLPHAKVLVHDALIVVDAAAIVDVTTGRTALNNAEKRTPDSPICTMWRQL
jgi:hypothetical protein